MLLYFMTLLNLSLGFEANTTVEGNLPIPRIYGRSDFDVGRISIHWLPVDDSGDETVSGYKAKMWEVGCVTKRRHVTVDGETKQVEERVMPRLRDYSTLRNLQEFSLEGVKNTSLILKNIPTDVPYHLMVSAYSVSGIGPLSSPFRFQLEGKYKCKEF